MNVPKKSSMTTRERMFYMLGTWYMDRHDDKDPSKKRKKTRDSSPKDNSLIRYELERRIGQDLRNKLVEEVQQKEWPDEKLEEVVPVLDRLADDYQYEFTKKLDDLVESAYEEIEDTVLGMIDQVQ